MVKSFSYNAMQKACDISVKRIDRYISVLAPLFFLEGGNVTLFSACIIGQENKTFRGKVRQQIL